MNNYYITFGTGHLDTEGRSLGDSYVKIRIESEAKARAIVFMLRGDKWAMSYTDKDYDEAIKQYNLTEKPLDSIVLFES